MPFEKIETRRKSAYAAEQLISAIKNGAYKAGDRLPPERELAERMGISRPLIREALSALQIAGIIESRAGDGTYIRKSIGNANIEDQVLSILEENENPIAVIEAREGLEEGIVKFAAERASAGDIEEPKKVLVEEREVGEKLDYARYVKADREFHLAIVSACQTPLLKTAVFPLINIRESCGEMEHLYLFNSRYTSQTLEEYEQIFDTIKHRNLVLAAEAMKQHLNNSKSRFLGDTGGEELPE